MNLLCCCCTMAPSTRVTRKWELFAGRNKFYCDGLLMSAPHTGVFYLTCFLITGTSALFFVFDCPFLATRITPAIPIVGAVLYFFTMSSLLRTTFTDPGVIPRASHDEAAYIEKQIEVPNSLNSPTYRPPPRTKEVLVKGQTVKLKYCFTCKIFRPPRASHCSLCDNCVDRFDHHCPWVGNCVGKRNYRFFYMFLVSLAFLAVFIFSCSVTHLVLLMKTEQEVFEVIKKAPFSVVVTFICFFSIWSVIGLAGFHTYLTTSDQTTNEDLKGSFSSKGGQRAINPYSRGNICLNCVHILCGPMTPSLIDRRGVVTDEYILQMQHNSQNPNNQLLTDVTIPPSQLVTNQPSISGADPSLIAKHRAFDDNNPGIYRHRSYDNLQNGNSNSLARLVDNEIPLSTRDGPGSGSGGGVVLSDNSQISPTITDDIDNIDNNIMLTRQRLNNLSGSYNNLFRDNVDNILFYGGEDKDNLSIDGDFKMNDTLLLSSSSSPPPPPSSSTNGVNTVIGRQLGSSLPTSVITTTANVMATAAAAVIHSSSLCHSLRMHDFSHLNELNSSNLRKSASESENVYSNIPNSNISSSAVSSNGSNKSDPNLHVYSNLIEEQHHQQQQQQQQQHQSRQSHYQQQQLLQSQSNNLLNMNKTLSLSLNKIHNIQHKEEEDDCEKIIVENIEPTTTIISSTLLSDDLDLDDPVSAFVVNSRKKSESASKAKIRKNSDHHHHHHHHQHQQQQQQNNLLPQQNKDSIVTIPDHMIKSEILSLSSSTEVTPGGTKITTPITATATTTTQLVTSNSSTLTSPQSCTTAITTTTNNKDRDAVGFITPSRLRLLQDTTMINTALDLDSLDGSSIGNNSQSCLVKTAMV